MVPPCSSLQRCAGLCMRRISALYPSFSPTILGFVRVFTVSVRHVACARPSVYNLRCHRGGLSSRAASRTNLPAARQQLPSRAISRTILQDARNPLPTRTSNRNILLDACVTAVFEQLPSSRYVYLENAR